MSVWEIILIGLGLSMDAVAVSLSNSLACKNLTRKWKLAMPVAFGVFQGLMPVIGFYAGSLFASFISRYAGVITFLILGVIGVNMIKEALSKDDADDEDNARGGVLTIRILFVQAVATSIDAFAVGVSFCATGADIFAAAPIIALTTFLCSLAAVFIGRRFGSMLGSRAEILGGLILIVIGIKALF